MMWLLCGIAVFLSSLCLVNSGVVSRKTWDAVSPLHFQYLSRPVSIVIIQHTVSRSCGTDYECESVMRELQVHHMNYLGHWDIQASFYVGGNGKIYEGTGWLHTGSHTSGFDNRSIGISFIGNYNKDAPMTAQMDAVKDFIRCGVVAGHLTQNYHVVGEKQLIATQSPGRKLYNAIRRWPEWLEDISLIQH